MTGSIKQVLPASSAVFRHRRPQCGWVYTADYLRFRTLRIVAYTQTFPIDENFATSGSSAPPSDVAGKGTQLALPL